MLKISYANRQEDKGSTYAYAYAYLYLLNKDPAKSEQGYYL